jgi:eukaryotic-like serine/threonine-protein kinase
MEPARYERLIGTSLADRWVLDALVGVGGAAAVYAATHRNGKRVAIKILHRELSLDQDFVSRFVQEGYVANRIEHPGIVSVLDDGKTEDGLAFLVMELLYGQTLAAHVEASPGGLPAAVAVAIVDEVLGILAAAHALGIVHRDVKPENIFVAQEEGADLPSIKLLDFGIAQFRANPNRAHVTESGTRLGTPAFMPPEQARGHMDQVDARSDLFSLGATLYSMLTKRTLRDASTPNERLLQAMTAPVPEARTLYPTGPESLWTLLDGALAFTKDQRFVDAKAMQSAARAAAQALGDAPTATLRLPSLALLRSHAEATESTARTRTRAPTRTLIAGTGVLGLLGVGAIAISSSRATPLPPLPTVTAVASAPAGSEDTPRATVATSTERVAVTASVTVSAPPHRVALPTKSPPLPSSGTTPASHPSVSSLATTPVRDPLERRK